MQVKELLVLLKEVDPDLLVCKPGHEGGLTDITSVKVEPIFLNANTDWHYGPHETLADIAEHAVKSVVLR